MVAYYIGPLIYPYYLLLLPLSVGPLLSASFKLSFLPFARRILPPNVLYHYDFEVVVAPQNTTESIY